MAADTLTHRQSSYDGVADEWKVIGNPSVHSLGSSPVIAFKTPGFKFHKAGRFNTIKKSEVLKSGQMVGYKETDGVREWSAFANNGATDTEKQPQGVFVCVNDMFHKRDVAKHILTGEDKVWFIVTGGAYVNLSRLYTSNQHLVIKADYLPSLGTGATAGIDLTYPVATDKLPELQQLEDNTTLRVVNDIPHIVSYMYGFMVPVAQ